MKTNNDLTERIYSLDGLKGLMCILIVFYHYFDKASCFPNVIEIIKSYLFHCVELFLAISGFGMALSYKNKVNEMSFKAFLCRRLKRLYPIYSVTLVTSCILYHVDISSPKESVYSIINNILTFFCMGTGWFWDEAPHNIPAWSVCVLVLCYVYFYIVCKISKENYLLYYSLIIAIIVICLVGIYFEWNFPLFYFYRSLRGLLAFFSGVLVFEGYKNIKTYLKIQVPIILCIVMICVLENGIYHFNLAIICLIICPLCLFITIYCKPVKRLLSTRVFQFLGKISMSIYLWHYAVLFIARKIISPDTLLIGFICYMISSVLIAVISMRIIEPKINLLFAKLIKEER